MSLKFGQLQLLVSMAADRVKRCCHFFPAVFYPILFILAYMMTCMRAQRCLKFSQIRLLTAELAALERLKKKSPNTYNGKNGVAIFSQLFLNKLFSYLQKTMTYI